MIDGGRDDLPSERLVSSVYGPISGYVSSQDRQLRRTLGSDLAVVLQQSQTRSLPKYDRRKRKRGFTLSHI